MKSTVADASFPDTFDALRNPEAWHTWCLGITRWAKGGGGEGGGGHQPAKRPSKNAHYNKQILRAARPARSVLGPKSDFTGSDNYPFIMINN